MKIWWFFEIVYYFTKMLWNAVGTKGVSGSRNPQLILFSFQIELNAEVTTDDPRVEFIQEFASNKLKVKVDKWRKSLSQDENKQIIQHFFDQPTIWFLVLSSPVSWLDSFWLSATLHMQVTDPLQRVRFAARADRIRHICRYRVATDSGKLTSQLIFQFNLKFA